MRSSARVWVLVGVLGFGLALVVGAWWIEGRRPGRVTVDATPASATIRVGAHTSVGHLDVEVPPGPVQIDVQAPGHLPWSLQTTVPARSTLAFTPELRPLAVAP
jgi:hypothetical protein